MIKTIINPPYIILIHKISGRKYNTKNSDYIQYDDKKIDIKFGQNKLI